MNRRPPTPADQDAWAWNHFEPEPGDEYEPPKESECWLCGAKGSDPCQHNRPWECPYDRS